MASNVPLTVNIKRKDDGSIHLTQPHLIDAILKDLKLDSDPRMKPKLIPALSSKLLSRHSASDSFDKSFDYHSVIGTLQQHNGQLQTHEHRLDSVEMQAKNIASKILAIDSRLKVIEQWEVPEPLNLEGAFSNGAMAGPGPAAAVGATTPVTPSITMAASTVPVTPSITMASSATQLSKKSTLPAASVKAIKKYIQGSAEINRQLRQGLESEKTELRKRSSS